MYAARRSGLKREMFGYVPGGYARILDALRERLTENGVYLMLGTRVRRIESDPPVGVTVETGSGSRIQFDRVVLTVPTPTAAYLCPGLTDDEQSRLGSVEYLGIVCASVLLKKPLAGYYVTNITESWVPFTGVIEMSALVGREQFGGHTLVYLPKYLPSGDSAFTESDEVWQETFLGALYRMYPELSEDDVLSFRVSRERYVQPLWTLGYSKNIPSKTTSLPGVFVVNSAQITDAIPTVNQAIRLADESLPALLGGDPVPMPGTTTGISE
jgi:protoporphyrinogen oxidase